MRAQTRDLDLIASNTAGMTRAILPVIPDQRPMQFTNRGQLHTFQRKYVYGTITASVSVDQAGAIYFTLSALPNATEFTALFDEYRFLQTQVEFLSLTTGPYISPLTTVIDYDDANAVSSLNELLEYETSSTTSSGANQVRVLRPRASMGVYGGAFTNFAAAPFSTWFDCASATTQFYGVKYYLPALTGGTTTAVYSIRVTATVQFRGIR